MVKTIHPGFILLPLYIYPVQYGQNMWAPLFSAATNHPNLSFLVVIDIMNGPGPPPCPDASYTAAIHTLNSHSNIIALGYVHTAARYNCGTGQDICPATRTQLELQGDIDQYANWSSPTGCSRSGSPTIQVDGIFFDEAPAAASSVPYMQTISAYARKKLPNARIVNNPGLPVDPGYWKYADYINVFENTEAIYRTTNVPALAGTYKEQATVIIHDYTSNLQQLETDVDTIIDSDIDDFAGVFITNRTAAENEYIGFPSFWSQLCDYVDAAN